MTLCFTSECFTSDRQDSLALKYLLPDTQKSQILKMLNLNVHNLNIHNTNLKKMWKETIT